jgi:deoxyribodipyrimidine photo-lyase
MPPLPTPPATTDGDPSDVEGWVEDHLGHLTDDPEVVASPRFRGGQTAADAALALLDIGGYRAKRNEVWPPERRGATAISPYVRHGLVQLPELWDAVAGAPRSDRDKYRDELLWQEFARHWYARLGTATRQPVRNHPPHRDLVGDPWDPAMRCMEVTVDELERDGWLVNQTRMWLSSQWVVRHGADWRDGEDRFFRHLLDGSRAANRSGWQWTVGAGSHKAYGFSRYQVEKRAPTLCRECPLSNDCPIEDWPEDPPLPAVDPPVPGLRRDPDVAATAGPVEPEVTGTPDAVWLTAESLGDTDPALAAHPDLPVVFVLDEPLLEGLRLASKRLVFLVECLGDLATRREVEVHLGDPVEVLADRPVATTFAPVPGFRTRAAALDVVALHPWPWLRRPHAGSLTSFTAWRKGLA